MNWSNTLKVGDEIGCYKIWNGNFSSPKYGTVNKINGHGHITVAAQTESGVVELVFDKHGEERNVQFGFGHMLMDAGPLREVVASQNEAREKRNALNTAKKELKQLLDNCTNGRGDFCGLSSEQKSLARSLIDKM